MLLTNACCPKLSSNPNSISQPRPRASSSSGRSISLSQGHSGQRSGRPTAPASSPRLPRVTCLRHVAGWASSTSRPRSSRFRPSLAGSSSTTPITLGQSSFHMSSPWSRSIAIPSAASAEQSAESAEPEQQQQPTVEPKTTALTCQACHLVHTGSSPAQMRDEPTSKPSLRHRRSHPSRPS